MNTNELITYLISPVGQVALIMALAEIIKRQEIMAPKFIFLVDLALGVILGIAVFGAYLGMEPIPSVILGLADGCIAAGVFSGIKNLRETYDEPDFVVDEEEDGE